MCNKSVTLYAWDINEKYDNYLLGKISKCIICNGKTIKNHNDCNKNSCGILREPDFKQLVTTCSFCVKCKEQFNLDKRLVDCKICYNEEINVNHLSCKAKNCKMIETKGQKISYCCICDLCKKKLQ